MFSGWKYGVAAALFALPVVVGCASDKPSEYGSDRPPADQVDPRDTGLQGFDVMAASDKMANDLLSQPELNASRTQWTIVVDKVEDDTTDNLFRHNYDIFIERLRTRLFQLGKGRVRLIENKARYHDLQNKELDNNERDDFGQGPGDHPVPPAVVQPDYVLYGKAIDMPNRATTYYLLQFDLTNFNTREQVWSGEYEVRTAR
jgi:PBP1b-binding outer membrane lipoprotein LpoB